MARLHKALLELVIGGVRNSAQFSAQLLVEPEVQAAEFHTAWLETVLDRLLFENKALKTDLVDIRRLLGHIELAYTQLEGQFEKQALKILCENHEVAEKLGSDWKALRNYVTLTTLLLLVAIAAAVLLL